MFDLTDDHRAIADGRQFADHQLAPHAVEWGRTEHLPLDVLEQVRVPAANRLGAEGDGFKIAMSGLNGGRINIGASSLGGGRAALEKSLAYSADRKAFGKSAMAKKFATDAGFDVANRALQIHGGYGYLAEYGIEKIVRDLRVHQILEGSNEIMQLLIARSLVRQ